MAVLVILVLAVLWGAVLIPPILRSRSSSGRFGLSDFTDGLRSLGGRATHSRPPVGGPAFGGPVLHGPVGRSPLGTGPGPVGPYSGYAAPYGGAPFGGPPVGPMARRAPLPVPTPFGPVGPGMSPMQRRRRNVLIVLGSAVGVTLILAMATQLILLYLLFVVASAALGGYCYLLVQFKNRSALGRVAPMQHVVVSPVAPVDEQARPVDNVILLRRNVS